MIKRRQGMEMKRGKEMEDDMQQRRVGVSKKKKEGEEEEVDQRLGLKLGLKSF